MLEKRNIEEKDAAGDAGALDDIVDMAAGKMGKAAKAAKAAKAGPRRRERELAGSAVDAAASLPDSPATGIC